MAEEMTYAGIRGLIIVEGVVGNGDSVTFGCRSIARTKFYQAATVAGKLIVANRHTRGIINTKSTVAAVADRVVGEGDIVGFVLSLDQVAVCPAADTPRWVNSASSLSCDRVVSDDDIGTTAFDITCKITKITHGVVLDHAIIDVHKIEQLLPTIAIGT